MFEVPKLLIPLEKQPKFRVLSWAVFSISYKTFLKYFKQSIWAYCPRARSLPAIAGVYALLPESVLCAAKEEFEL